MQLRIKYEITIDLSFGEGTLFSRQICSGFDFGCGCDPADSSFFWFILRLYRGLLLGWFDLT